MTAILTPRRRPLAVTRLHFVNIRAAFLVPWLVIACVFVVNVAIWWAITATTSGSDLADAREGLQYSGSTAFVFVYMFMFAVQSIVVTFPFAQGYGVTRRAYSAGTALSYVILSVAYAVVLTILGGIEEATDGWGLGGRMFSAIYFGAGEWYSRFFVFLTFSLFSFFVAAMFAAIYVRWRATGLVFAFAILAVLVAACIFVGVLSLRWGVVFEIGLPTDLGLVALTLVPTAVAAVIGYLVLRRVAPRN